MMFHSKTIDLIERENDAEPLCACGAWTTPVWRNGAIWLDCNSLAEPRSGRMARLGFCVVEA